LDFLGAILAATEVSPDFAADFASSSSLRLSAEGSDSEPDTSELGADLLITIFVFDRPGLVAAFPPEVDTFSSVEGSTSLS
jgi:hypothetical protein